MTLPWRLHGVRLRVGTTITWFALGFVFAALAMAVAPMAAGLHTYSVRSGSMTPAIRTGDVVLTRTIDPGSAKVGQIVTFRDPVGGSDTLITHRVRAVKRIGSRYHFVTRGDDNNVAERWTVPAAGSIGRVVWRLPMLGYAVSPLDSQAGRLGLIALPAVLLLAIGLRRIWSDEEAPAKATEA